jgi:hypothetical protein
MNALDTHRLVKRLVAVGFSDEQAETVTDVVREGREADVSNLATKGDVSTAVAQLRTEIAEAKADILKWVIGLLLVQGGVVVTLIKLLPGH